VGFVVPLGADAGRSLEMPRGSVPIIDLAGRLGIPPAAPLRCAVAVAHGDDYLAFGVESVDLVYEGDPAVPELLSLDPG